MASFLVFAQQQFSFDVTHVKEQQVVKIQGTCTVQVATLQVCTGKLVYEICGWHDFIFENTNWPNKKYNVHIELQLPETQMMVVLASQLWL